MENLWIDKQAIKLILACKDNHLSRRELGAPVSPLPFFFQFTIEQGHANTL